MVCFMYMLLNILIQQTHQPQFLLPEEDRWPCKVQRKLCAVQGQGERSLARESTTVAVHHVGGVPHRRVQARPHWGKHPAWGLEWWLLQCLEINRNVVIFWYVVVSSWSLIRLHVHVLWNHFILWAQHFVAWWWWACSWTTEFMDFQIKHTTIEFNQHFIRLLYSWIVLLRNKQVAHLRKRSKATVEPIIENPRGIIWTTLVEDL